MPDAVTENGVVLAPFEKAGTTVISTEASDTPSHSVISTEASGSERSGEIPQTESQSPCPPCAKGGSKGGLSCTYNDNPSGAQERTSSLYTKEPHDPQSENTTSSHPVIDAIAPSANNRYSVAPLLTTVAEKSRSHHCPSLLLRDLSTSLKMTMVATDKRGYNKAKKKGGAIENRPAP